MYVEADRDDSISLCVLGGVYPDEQMVFHNTQRMLCAGLRSEYSRTAELIHELIDDASTQPHRD